MHKISSLVAILLWLTVPAFAQTRTPHISGVVAEAYATACRYYPEECWLVTDVRFATPAQHETAWVLDDAPTIIYLSYDALDLPQLELEALFVHEITHVVQLHDPQPADHAAREREARVTERLFIFHRKQELASTVVE